MKRHNPGFLRVVDAAKARIAQMDAADVAAAHRAGEAPLIVDVRERSEWDAGHIAGAIHVGKGVIERDIEGAVPDLDTALVLYCGGGYRSALAADVLQQMGYTRVWSMAGGWREWRAADGAVVMD
jgi:rhodanese-related sulfurtransferase